MSNAMREPEASGPWTLDGQRIGALLAVKRTSHESPWESSLEVGDLVEVQQQKAHKCVVRSKRTNETVERNRRCEMDDRQEYSAWLKDTSGNTIIPSAPLNSIALRKIAEPSTLEGQELGAILVAKQKPLDSGTHRALAPGSCGYEVGDFLELCSATNDLKRVVVKSLRIGKTGQISWEAVWPMGTGQQCACYAGVSECRCVYEDFRKSVEYDKARRDELQS